MNNSNNAISVKNLTKKYKSFTLDNVSFTIPKGICCGFVGPNGAGKTTTLKLLLEMIKKDGGEVEIIPKSKTSVLFDQPYFAEEWNVLDIEKAMKMFYENWDSQLYRKYLKNFALEEDKKFKDFSRGTKMKLGLAVCLSHNADLLLLDEPTGGLDPVVREEVLDIMRDYLQDENKTILFSTHITSDLENIADMIIYISNGKIHFAGDKDELLESYCVIKGGKLPAEKQKYAIGMHKSNLGFECLMAVSNIANLGADVITEKSTINDIVVFMERESKKSD
ncbi:MAG: ABC transporter ATP-binding protein [Ruminococcus sp.]|jgi:ABC-2 type transport system ATP-binding protein|nr:ABC transporter ATP-binding protein [Ruminococcus sp.]